MNNRIIHIEPLALLVAVLCILFLAEPVDGKSRKRRHHRRHARVVRVQNAATDSDSVTVAPVVNVAKTTALVVPADTIADDSLKTDSLPWPESLRVRIDSVIAQSDLLATTQFGMKVYDLTADSVLYSFNEENTLRPASTMKLITAITALDKLGGSYQYKTYLRHTGDVSSGNRTLNGNVYVVGGLDPRFNRDDLTAFIETLKSMGIDTICGNVCADRSFKDSLLLGEGWCWDDDNPVLSPLLYYGSDSLMVAFCKELTDNGIIVKGDTIDEQAPDSAINICMRAHSIDQILVRMMKESDNLYAESMYYQLAATHGRPATADGARAEVRALIRKVGLNPDKYRLADGSGLSLYNYLSPRLEVEFLKYAYGNSAIYNHLRPSLPIAGVDGTLAKRMIGTAAEGNVMAKTGTETAVSCLAGYLTAANGHILTFSIMNQGSLTASRPRAFQDKVCEVMCKK